jgi:hypothetical protein
MDGGSIPPSSTTKDQVTRFAPPQLVTDWSQIAERPTEGIGCSPVVLGRHVLVHAHRDSHVGMPEALCDDLDRNAGTQRHRCHSGACVVQPDSSCANAIRRFVPPPRDRLGMRWLAEFINEHEPTIRRRATSAQPFLGCRLRQALSAAEVPWSMDTIRAPALVFGAPVTIVSATTRVSTTSTVPAATLTSRQRRPHSSPRRSPVARTRRQSGYSRSSRAATRKAAASSSDQAVISPRSR